MADPATSAAALASYTGVYVFGDSLVDPGNDLKAFNAIKQLPIDNLPDGAPTSDKGYFFGRFSDGFNFADLISNKLLHKATEPTFPYGVSNAFGGFSTGSIGRPDGNNLSFAYGGALATQDNPAPSLHTQLDVYSNFNPDPNALYVISIGSNDLLSLVPTGGTPTTGSAADAKISAVANEIVQDVAQLLSRGARHLVVADIPDLGVTPAYSGAIDEATRRSLLTQYAEAANTQLKAGLAGLTLPAGATVLTYDAFAYTDAATGSPSSFDFSNTTQALTTVQPGSPDPTGAGFLFFDKLHPTAEAHAQIASQILGELANGGTAPVWTHAAPPAALAGALVATNTVDNFTATLTAGHSYVVDLLGVSSASGTLADPQVRVLDGSGAVVAQGDDGGVGLDTHFQFTAPSSGPFTVEVSGVGGYGGSFELQAADAGGGDLFASGRLTGANYSLWGNVANDTLTAAAGSNVLMGGDGNDSIQGGTGFDRVNGNRGDDVIVGRSAVGDWLLGGQGSDSIDASQSAGHNILNGNIGADTLLAGSGGDTLRGGQGDDLITGGTGADFIAGDLGANTLVGGGGADIFHAGPGSDLVRDFSQSQGDRVQFDAGVTYQAHQVGADTVVDFSNGGHMTLAGVQASSLQNGWIFGG